MSTVTNIPCPRCNDLLHVKYTEDTDHRGRYLAEYYWCETCHEEKQVPVAYVERATPIKEDR